MGREFVKQLDRDEIFDEIWVIARRRDRLEALADTTRAKIRPVPLDLADASCMETYAALLEKEKPDVRVLVCASGYGRFGAVTEVPLAVQTGMIDLNVRALTEMTYLTLPYMKSGARIFELGSLSAFQPVPYICVYGATKAYVLSFSRALGRGACSPRDPRDGGLPRMGENRVFRPRGNGRYHYILQPLLYRGGSGYACHA